VKSNGRTIDVAYTFFGGVESIAIDIEGASIVLDLGKARFLMQMLKDTIDAQEANRRVREMKARFDISGTTD